MGNSIILLLSRKQGNEWPPFQPWVDLSTHKSVSPCLLLQEQRCVCLPTAACLTPNTMPWFPARLLQQPPAPLDTTGGWGLNSRADNSGGGWGLMHMEETVFLPSCPPCRTARLTDHWQGDSMIVTQYSSILQMEVAISVQCQFPCFQVFTNVPHFQWLPNEVTLEKCPSYQ